MFTAQNLGREFAPGGQFVDDQEVFVGPCRRCLMVGLPCDAAGTYVVSQSSDKLTTHYGNGADIRQTNMVIPFRPPYHEGNPDMSRKRSFWVGLWGISSESHDTSSLLYQNYVYRQAGGKMRHVLFGNAVLPSLDPVSYSSLSGDDDVEYLQSHFVNFGRGSQKSFTLRCTQGKTERQSERIILKAMPLPVGTAIPVMKIWQGSINSTATIGGYPKSRRLNERELYGRLISNELYSDPFPNELVAELEKDVWAHITDRVNLQLIVQGKPFGRTSVSRPIVVLTK
jgi:hypothetical protein